MIEQLVEKALNDALCTGSMDRHRRAGGRHGKVRGNARPAVDVGFGGRWPRRNEMVTHGQAKASVVHLRRQVRIERRQPVQPPDGELRDRDRFQGARGHEGQRGRVNVGYEIRVDTGRGDDSLGVRRGDQQQDAQDADADHLGLNRTPFCGLPPGRSGTPCRMWKTRPPLTGLASASRTSTS